jgi:hypothetical protein
LLSLGAEHLPRRKFIAEIAQLVKERAPSWRLDADLAGSLAHLPRVLRPGVDARP